MKEGVGHSLGLKRKLELVVQAGLALANDLDLKAIVQTATDAGLELCGAQFGAFFYRDDEEYTLHALAGAHKEVFSRFQMPRPTAVFAETFGGRSILRSDDITADPRFGRSAPHFGLPPGHPKVRSYLAVPVRGLSGQVLGGMFYGHAEAGRFERDAEDLVTTVAVQAGSAIENFRLREELERKIDALDAAERLRADTAKRLAELAAIVESSDDAILSKNLDGIIVTWNAAAQRMFGYAPEEIIGKSILMLIPPELQSEETTIIRKIRAGERIDHFETVRMAKSGEKREVSLSISPVRDESGTVVGASKILRDISSRKRMQDSVLQSEKIAATGRMAATIAHEINNPLEGVVNLLYLAKTCASDPEQISFLTAAEGEVARVSHIAKQTLGYYREHSSAVRTCVAGLVRDAITVYSPKCSASGIQIKVELRTDRELMVRRGELMQVISNLIANAIYAMPDGGTLCLSVEDTRTPERGVVIAVQDTGVGIAEDQLPRIFEAFYTTRGQIGTGIGLFVARQFVEGHGGTISVETSTAAPHGTTMSIFLPLHTAYAPAETRTGRELVQ